MKALVVYDSVYGNTEQIAQAIGKALGSPEEVQILRVGDARPDRLTGFDLIIAGSPTQKFRPLPAMSGFLKGIPKNSLNGVRVAAFDTRMTVSDVEKVRILAFFVRIFGYAAKPVLAALQKHGGSPAAVPEGFYVLGTEGPLQEGELERASDWARRILAAQ